MFRIFSYIVFPVIIQQLYLSNLIRNKESQKSLFPDSKKGKPLSISKLLLFSSTKKMNIHVECQGNSKPLNFIYRYRETTVNMQLKQLYKYCNSRALKCPIHASPGLWIFGLVGTSNELDMVESLHVD